jgi:hypothetical protein
MDVFKLYEAQDELHQLQAMIELSPPNSETEVMRAMAGNMQRLLEQADLLVKLENRLVAMGDMYPPRKHQR